MAGNFRNSGIAISRAAAVGFALIAGLAPLAGCRFKSPTMAEQQELQRRGALAQGSPAWMATPTGGAGATGRASSGFLPESYSASLSGAAVSPVYSTIDQQDQYRRDVDDKTAAAAAKSSAAVKEGPLDRIERACPGLEKEVNDALTTTDSAERTAKYHALTQKCTASADLWIWTGKAYLTQGRLADSERAFDQAIGIDPQNTEASDLLTEVRKQRKKTAADKDAAPKAQ